MKNSKNFIVFGFFILIILVLTNGIVLATTRPAPVPIACQTDSDCQQKVCESSDPKNEFAPSKYQVGPYCTCISKCNTERYGTPACEYARLSSSLTPSDLKSIAERFAVKKVGQSFYETHYSMDEGVETGYNEREFSVYTKNENDKKEIVTQIFVSKCRGVITRSPDYAAQGFIKDQTTKQPGTTNNLIILLITVIAVLAVTAVIYKVKKKK